MSDTKIFSFPDSGSSAGLTGIAAMLPALLQSRGTDPGYLMGLMNSNKGNGGFFGNNGGFQDIIALIVIAAIFGNGNGGGIFGGNNGSKEGRDMIMQALNRNGVDTAALAQAVNTSSDQILAGINSVSQAICGLGNQMGQSTNQILTALLQGNNALTSQICSCCCDLKSLVTNQGYENRLATINQTNELKSDANTHFNVVGAKIDAQTQIINDKFCQLEMREMQNKLDKVREENSAYKTSAMTSQIVGQATAPLGAALADLSARLAKIECKQPETITVPNPQGVVIPSCVAAQMGLGLGFNGLGLAGGFWG